MALAKRSILSSLQRKGFVPRDRPGDHIYLVYYDLLGKKTQVLTKVSHGSKGKTIGNVLIGRMARQCKVSTSEFVRLVDCSMDREEYDTLIGSTAG